MMNVLEAIVARKSTRAFLDKPVASDLIRQVLEYARHAPSGANTQPWQVAVVSGDKKNQLQALMIQAYENGQAANMNYQYYPLDWREPYKRRRTECGLQLYNSLGIKREDKEKRRSQWLANYRAFDAPVMLFFFMEHGMQTGSFLDYGMFLQSVMLAAQALGLASCPQAALGEYPKIVKNYLQYPEDSILVCGMALGYEDCDAAVNAYRTPRESVENFSRFFDEL